MENHDQSNHNSQSEQRKISQATSENSSRPSARFVFLGGVRTPVKRSIEVKPMQCRSLSAPEFKSLCSKNGPNTRCRLCLTYFTALEDSSACFMEVFLRKINPLTPMSDQDWITPYTEFWNNIKQTSDENKEKYQLGDISWSNTKFSKITSWELYDKKYGELLIWSWEWKGEIVLHATTELSPQSTVFCFYLSVSLCFRVQRTFFDNCVGSSYKVTATSSLYLPFILIFRDTENLWNVSLS